MGDQTARLPDHRLRTVSQRWRLHKQFVQAFFSSELFKLDVNISYPLVWNDLQKWTIDVYLVECGTALGVKLFPLRLSQCNSLTNDYEKGLSIFISKVEIKQYLNEANRSALHTSTVTTTNTPSCSNSHSISKRNDRNGSQSWNKNENFEEITVRPFDSNDFNYWFECGNATLGPIVLDMTLDKGELTAFYFWQPGTLIFSFWFQVNHRIKSSSSACTINGPSSSTFSGTNTTTTQPKSTNYERKP